MFIRLNWILLLTSYLLGCQTWSDPQQGSAESTIRAWLASQTADGNRGDIEAFMEGYVNSEDLRFAGATRVNRGYAATLARYRKAYPRKAGMGQLRFSDLEIVFLSRKHAEVFGRYHLKRRGSYKDATGLFTLLLEKSPNGWKILHDHSSALKS